MAVIIGRKLIEKYVLKKLAERSGKRTGITTIQNVKDPQVQFNIEEVRKTIKSLGMDPNDVKSVAEIEKIMNIRKAVSDQTIKNKFKNLGLDKGVDDLAKKPPFQGFTPTIVGKPAKGNINYPEIEKKFGFPLRGNESLSELAKIERIGRDSYYDMLANRAMNIRRRMSKVDAEGGTEIGYQEFNKLQEELDGLNDFITRVQKEVPEDFASGGLARVGYVGGKLVKGAPWFIKNLRQAYDELITGKSFTNLDEMQKEFLRFEILAQIKNIEKGGPIPQDMINAMRKDKRFKDITKTRSTDPELYDVEEVLLNPDVDQLKDIKKLEQKEMLEQFDVTGRTKQAAGGLANILGV